MQYALLPLDGTKTYTVGLRRANIRISACVQQKEERNTNRGAAGTHADLCLLATSQESEKYFVPPQSSDSNVSVDGQKDGVQRGGNGPGSAPAPAAYSGPLLIQTQSTCSVQVQP